MWAAGHDLWSPNLISECVRLLEDEPRAVIAFASSKWIDADGNPLARYLGWTDTRGMDRVARFYAVLWGNMHPVLGVIRSEALRRIGRIVRGAGADLILLSELVLQGHFVHARAAFWCRREFREHETHEQRMNRYQHALSNFFLSRFFPLMHLPLQLIRVVLCSQITWFEKACILLTLIPVLPVRYLTGRKRHD